MWRVLQRYFGQVRINEELSLEGRRGLRERGREREREREREKRGDGEGRGYRKRYAD